MTPGDDLVRTRIDEWERSGTIDAVVATRLRDHEDHRDAARATSAAPTSRRAVAAEAVGYVGAAFALGALILLLVDVWGGLTELARTGVAALATVLLLGAGAALRGVANAAMQRLTSVLWTAAVGTVAWTVGLAGSYFLDLAEARLALVVSFAAFVTALPLYLLRRRLLLQAALLVSLLGLATSTLFDISPLEPEARVAGSMVVAIGLAWMLLGMGRWLAPTVVAEVFGMVLALVGTQIVSSEPPRWVGLGMGVLFASALVVLAVRTDTRHPLFIGAAALFVLTPQLVFDLFEDTIGAPATLLVIGLLLVLLAVGLTRARREIAPGAHHDAPPSVPGTPAGGEV